MAVKLQGGQATLRRKLMVLVHGFHGVGKTSFALTFPPPFFVFNLDRDMDYLIALLPETTELEYEFILTDSDSSVGHVADGHLAKFDRLLASAIRAGTGTFVVDGLDLLWDLVKIAKVPGGGNDSMPRDWEKANEWMNHRLRRLSQSPLHVCMTTMSTRIWAGLTKETERVRADGFKHRGRWLTHEVYLFTPDNPSEPVAVPAQGPTGQSHLAYIGVSKINESLVGRVIPSLTFGLLYRLAFGENYPEAGCLWSPARAASAAPSSEAAGASS